LNSGMASRPRNGNSSNNRVRMRTVSMRFGEALPALHPVSKSAWQAASV
jgi:hypothetical protein